MEAIVLAGGFGTRLKKVIGNIPKPMAPINNLPFLTYLFEFLLNNNISTTVLSVYYKYHLIKDYYNNSYKNLDIKYSIDNQELGTGGAIMNAILRSNNDSLYIVNGDTYFDVELDFLLEKHYEDGNDITLALKPMSNFERYGFVNIDSMGRVISLGKKEYKKNGLIDGGIYLINKEIFNNIKNIQKFSFNDFISTNLNYLKVGTFICDNLFIDIGTPEDYNNAHKVLINKL